MRPYFHFVALIHRCVHRFPNPANTISNVQFNQQGTRLLCREKNQLPFVYNFSNGQEVGGDQNRTRIMKFSSLGYAIPNCGINLSCFAGQTTSWWSLPLPITACLSGPSIRKWQMNKSLTNRSSSCVGTRAASSRFATIAGLIRWPLAGKKT